MLQKQTIRAEYKAKRLALTEPEIDRLSKQMHDWLFSRLMMHRYSHIHIFLPIERLKEVNTQLIINTLRKDFAPTLYLPRVENATAKTPAHLTHHVFTPATSLTLNEWGIAEPPADNPVPPTTFDLVFVPLLAFDKQGHRIGYGGGFYDNFLAQCSAQCTKVGLSLFDALPEPIATEDHDVRLDYCVTPNKIWTFKP